jgi:hypothetical protein
VVSGRRGVAVEASIGVDVGSSSGTTLRVARDAVEAVLREGDLDRESITLIVAYVSPRVAATPGAEDR